MNESRSFKSSCRKRYPAVLRSRPASESPSVNVFTFDGDGSRPARVLEFAGAPLGAVDTLALRLAGLYWKERELHAFRVASHEGTG